MPRVEELLEQLGKAEYITTLDLTKGYCQVSVASEDRLKTAFMAPMGKFEFTRMPFGLKGAPTTFQRLMDVILSPSTRFARAYQDDIVIFSETWEEHLEHLEEVFRRLEEAVLKAKPSKCVIATDHSSYLGHIVHGQIAMKLEALRNFRCPLCKKDVRAFLGSAGYYRRFILHFADLFADLTNQPQIVLWNEQLEMDFQRLKQQMCTRPVLHCPREEGQFILQTDASERGVGADSAWTLVVEKTVSSQGSCYHEKPAILLLRKSVLPCLRQSSTLMFILSVATSRL